MNSVQKHKKLEVSGYRGIWGQDLNEDITYKYSLAFAELVKEKGGKKILLGRDARPTGALMIQAAQVAIKQAGLTCEYAGIIPTPSMLLLTKKLQCDGAIMITASHNPAEYNGIKFVNELGLFTNQEEIYKIEEIKKSLNNEDYRVSPVQFSDPYDNKKFRDIHTSEILKNIDINLIKSKHFRVSLDSINSTGSIITKELLEALGCEINIINGKQDGDFVHMPEPRPENLTQIGEEVLKTKSDIGFAQDPDADRLVVINEKGEVLSEEYTLTLAIMSVLKEHVGPVVLNLSTSSTTEEVARKLGAEVYRSKIGELNVSEMILKVGAIIGGEGNGGVIYPKINLVRDSLVGIALILTLLAKENKNLSEIEKTLPKYFIKKDKVPVKDSLDLIYKSLKTDFPDAKANETEGLRLDWADLSWVHIRPSNTEPIIRIFGEAKSQARIDEIFSMVMKSISSN